MRIAVAGATGFVGCHFIEHLLEHTDIEIRALSRSEGKTSNPRLSFERVDLYSLLETEKALKECEAAIYLVHSMSPSSRLSQGSFENFDLLLADNFARAARKMGLAKIIYVSGLIPDTDHLSVHLASRLEVEQVLSSYGIPVITLRCGIVLGPNGSSFRILEKLVDRLPLMVLPRWMKHETQAIYIKDLVQVMTRSLLEVTETRVFDVGADEELTYADLLFEVIRHKNKKPIVIHLPQIPVKLSKLWIRLITRVPKDLVYPLVESLVHSMKVAKERQLPEEWRKNLTKIPEAVRLSLSGEPCRIERTQVKQPSLKRQSEVQSVQRLHLPQGQSAAWVASAYIYWLPRYFRKLLHAERQGLSALFYLRPFSQPLLILEHSEERSSEDRQLFYVSQGLLVKKGSKGRLEFRVSPDGKFVIAAIHRFRPRLPWFVYRFSQAVVHLFVMNRFDRYLQGKKP